MAILVTYCLYKQCSGSALCSFERTMAILRLWRRSVCLLIVQSCMPTPFAWITSGSAAAPGP